MKYSRISVIPLNPVNDYDYFITCLHRALHCIQPTNLVQVQHQLADVSESDCDESVMIVNGYNGECD